MAKLRDTIREQVCEDKLKFTNGFWLWDGKLIGNIQRFIYKNFNTVATASDLDTFMNTFISLSSPLRIDIRALYNPKAPEGELRWEWIKQYDVASLSILYAVLFTECFAFCNLWGKGGYGKSVLLSLVTHYFQTFSQATSYEQLNNKFNLGELAGKFAIVCDDNGEKERLVDNLYAIKSMLTREPITVERKHVRSFPLINNANFLFLANHKPYFNIADSGMRRRLIVHELTTKIDLSNEPAEIEYYFDYQAFKAWYETHYCVKTELEKLNKQTCMSYIEDKFRVSNDNFNLERLRLGLYSYADYLRANEHSIKRINELTFDELLDVYIHRDSYKPESLIGRTY